MLNATKTIENVVFEALNFDTSAREFVIAGAGRHPNERPHRQVDATEVSRLLHLPTEELIEICRKARGASRQITKKAWYADRHIELVSAILDCHPSDIIQVVLDKEDILFDLNEELENVLEYAFTVAFGERNESAVDSPDAEDVFSERWARCGRSLIGMQIGILVDDNGHRDDVVERVKAAWSAWKANAECLYEEWTRLLQRNQIGDEGIRSWVRKCFFDRHIACYSKSRRRAPIYWELALSSHGYAIWIYYHRFTRDTFYKVLNDYVKPKLTHEEQKLARVRAEARESPTRSQAKEVETQDAFVAS